MDDKRARWRMIPPNTLFFSIAGVFGAVAILGNISTGGAAGGFLLFAILFAVGAAIYFVPSIVAYKRKQRNLTAIFVLNLLAGWTFIGWVVAMVWACTQGRA